MEESQKEQQLESKQILATRNLLLSTLRELNCQPKIEDETVVFQYQGNFFYCYVEKKSINIVYPGWEEFDINNGNYILY